jgi:hypothetical protein
VAPFDEAVSAYVATRHNVIALDEVKRLGGTKAPS